jgi:serine/threonine protein kinase
MNKMNKLHMQTVKQKTVKHNRVSLKGGTYLGSGSYGCVVSPPLPCKQSHLSKKSFQYKKTKNNKNNKTKYVSKILKYSDKDSKHELTISSKIKKIDPRQTYFITYESVCQLKKVPKNRNNTVKVKYLNHNLKKYDVINNNGSIKSSGYINNHNNNDNSNKKCFIDTRLNPMNIIMPYGGFDLFDLKANMHKLFKEYKLSHQQKHIEFINTYTMIVNNFKYCFKHLAMGLYKLHKARIVNCDIKQENIMALYNTKTKKVDIKYIDFGFSEHLTPDYCKNYSNIKTFGTEQLLSTEIFITEILYENIYNSSRPININKITYEIKKSINENVKKILKDLKEYEYVDYLYNTYKDTLYKDTTIKNKQHIHKSIIETLYNEIINHFNNKTILDAYFGTNKVGILNGYLQKADVYALGITMYEFLTIGYQIIDVKKNMKLHHLLKKMIHPDPNKRYNILDCLKHSYFK